MKGYPSRHPERGITVFLSWLFHALLLRIDAKYCNIAIINKIYNYLIFSRFSKGFFDTFTKSDINLRNFYDEIDKYVRKYYEKCLRRIIGNRCA